MNDEQRQALEDFSDALITWEKFRNFDKSPVEANSPQEMDRSRALVALEACVYATMNRFSEGWKK